VRTKKGDVGRLCNADNVAEWDVSSDAPPFQQKDVKDTSAKAESLWLHCSTIHWQFARRNRLPATLISSGSAERYHRKYMWTARLQ
jgi:hypothetical protein